MGTTAEQAWTVQGVLDAARGFLERRGVDNPRLDSEVLLAHCLGLRRLDLYLQFDRPLSDTERAPYRALLKRRAAREPVAYLTGEREFYSLSFMVGPGALIPRPETETLIDVALEQAGSDPPDRFADVGVGSGCIAVTLLTRWPEARAVGIDVSTAALALARHNAERHGVSTRLDLVRADLGTALLGQTLGAVLSNPPYVTAAELPGLAPEIRDHEPAQALTSSADGLEHSRRLAIWIGSELKPDGFAVIECASQRADETCALFTAAAPARAVSLRPDLAGQGRAVVVGPSGG